MPLTWLGQLSPTMQQQIALQRALLALQREDEQIRLKTMPQAEKPALARKLVEGPGPAIPGGPTYQAGLGGGPVGSAFDRPSPSAFDRPSPSAFDEPSPSAFKGGGLEGALQTGVPVTGRPDWQAEAWARRKEIGEERVVSAKEAYDRIITLDPNGQKVALNALRRYKREVYNAMEREGYLSPAGELVKPAKEVKPMSRDTHVEDGWLYEDVLYDDGTSTHEIIGRAEEVEAEGVSVSEVINAQKLGINIEQHEERFYRDAIKFAGDIPRIGIDMVTGADGKERVAEQKDVDAWKTNVNNLIKFFRESSGTPSAGAPTMEEVKSMYEGRPDLISALQQQMGITITGVWDDTLEEAFKTYGGVE